MDYMLIDTIQRLNRLRRCDKLGPRADQFVHQDFREPLLEPGANLNLPRSRDQLLANHVRLSMPVVAVMVPPTDDCDYRYRCCPHPAGPTRAPATVPSQPNS